MDIESMMEVLRQRLFISHDHKGQKNIVHEYTIRSKIDGLSNIIILSEKFLPNLLAHDEKGNTLSIMPSKYVNALLRMHINEKQGYEKRKLEAIMSKINNDQLHLIWLKLSKDTILQKNEFKTITLTYAPKIRDPNFIFKMKIKNLPFPLYYTLYTPEDFDFDKTRYIYIKDDDFVSNYTKPNFVEMFKTYNSNMIRIVSKKSFSFIIEYSFRPTGHSTIATIIGLVTLSFLAGILLVTKWIIFPHYSYHFDVLEKHVEIGLFVIGASLILPRLTSNDSIRIRYAKKYIIPILLGGGLLI